jgi:hypothetical protein
VRGAPVALSCLHGCLLLKLLLLSKLQDKHQSNTSTTPAVSVDGFDPQLTSLLDRAHL